MLIALIGLITFGLLFYNLRKDSSHGVNLMDRFVRLMLYRRYGIVPERKRWINPITTHVSDYETHYFDPKLFPKERI